ncbi:MAG: DUF86 domain-containing protein [Chlamydiia bacterium]|nr:DUF86 domain-containing protein [Chlamydiia bacterium]
MVQKDSNRIAHILEAAKNIHIFVEGVNKERFLENQMLISAVVRELSIIGEAAAALSVEFKESMPDLPWREIIGMRNHLVHAYFDTDEELIWETIQKDLPLLLDRINGC